MVHHKNLRNVLTHGLLSHNDAHKKGLISTDISMAEVQEKRKDKPIIVNGEKMKMSLHEFVPFYFNTRNPMLYVRHDIQHELVILLISADIIDTKMSAPKFAIFSDGNATNRPTKFYSGIGQLDKLDSSIIFGKSWNHEDEEIKKENKRKRCAEVLIYPSVQVQEILKIICPNQLMLEFVKSLLDWKDLKTACTHIEVKISESYFF
jgi:hypothetical protein